MFDQRLHGGPPGTRGPEARKHFSNLGTAQGRLGETKDLLESKKKLLGIPSGKLTVGKLPFYS